MFIVSAKLSKSKCILFSFLLILLLLPVLALSGREETLPAPIAGETDRQRTDYLASLGWIAASTPSETLEFALPDPLGETYDAYNRLQKQQGFDLSQYAGQQVKRYSYPISNHPDTEDGVQADLYVCNGVVIGGDILRSGSNSSVSTLKYPD